MEYRTDGDKAVEHEEWPISSFGMSVSESVSQSVTMIIARDASASENHGGHQNSKKRSLSHSIKWLELAHSRILLLQRAVKSPIPKREPFLQSRRFKSPNSQSSNGCQCVPSISWTHRAMADSDACKSNPFVRFSCCNLIFNLNSIWAIVHLHIHIAVTLSSYQQWQSLAMGLKRGSVRAGWCLMVLNSFGLVSVSEVPRQ